MSPSRSRLILPPVLLVLLAALIVVSIGHLRDWLVDADDEMFAAAPTVAETLLWICIGWLCSRLIDAFIWLPMARRSGVAAPKLLIAVVRLLLTIVVLAIAYSVVFHQPLTGLAVSSGVLGVVLGFALQRMISDFFCGIALSMESPFKVGDWLEIDGVTGMVVETNWRATRLVTLEQVTVVVPNSLISEKRFLNYSLPQPYFRSEVTVPLDYDVPPAEAKRVLLAAVRAAEGVLDEPAPDVLLKEFTDRGANYVARFYVANYGRLQPTRDCVCSMLARHLWHAGMSVAYPKTDIYHAAMPQRDVNRKLGRRTLLSRVELFESLEAGELDELALRLVEHHCHAGDIIVRQGEPGASLFVVVDGLLDAKIHDNGEQLTVGEIGAGEFFGEMSLLTGSPRAATVVAQTGATLYELSKEVIAPIIQRRPQAAGAVSRLVAQRRLRNDAKLAQAEPDVKETQQRKFANELLQAIRGFFGLSD